MDKLKEMTVLLVDDDEAIRISMEYFFRHKTLLFTAVDSAELALKFIDTNGPTDIIIADFRLPGMDGLSFMKVIKKKCPNVLTMMITAYGDTVSLKKARNLEIHSIVKKPFRAGTIVTVLERLAQAR